MENKNKFILLENENQTLEYLKNKDKFLNATPISFTFSVEKLLLDNGIKFKIEEDYESDNIYRGHYNLMIKNSEEICKKINLKYRGIDLMGLFYIDLSNFLGRVNRYERILKNIKDKEKPKEIVLLIEEDNLNQDYEVCSKVAECLFQNSNVISYNPKNKRTKGLNWVMCSLQKIISRVNLKRSRKGDNKIFFCGSKSLFEPIISCLQKNRKNKIFRCKDKLQASFFVDKKYIPFYQFDGQKSNHQERLKQNIDNFKRSRVNVDFLNDLDIDKKIIPILKKWINYYLDFKFIEISRIINSIIKLMEEEKIDLILLYSDSLVFEKTFAQVGKRFNIPSLVLQHGVIGNKRGFYPISADYILVFGERSKKRLIKFGVLENKIIITGAFQFDKYLNKDILKQKKKIKRKKTLEEELYKLDGKSTERVVSFINRLLLKKK